MSNPNHQQLLLPNILDGSFVAGLYCCRQTHCALM
jgi:hypothetical protein